MHKSTVDVVALATWLPSSSSRDAVSLVIEFPTSAGCSDGGRTNKRLESWFARKLPLATTIYQESMGRNCRECTGGKCFTRRTCI